MMEKALAEGQTQPWGRVLSWKVTSEAQSQKVALWKNLWDLAA